MKKKTMQIISNILSFLKKTKVEEISNDNLKIRVCAKTDKGLIRYNNEDNYVYITNDDKSTGLNISERGMLFAIADGMGGHAAGEVASRIACDSILTYYNFKKFKSSNIISILKNIFIKTNLDIINKSIYHSELSGMGTTLSVLVLINKTALIAHIGDTRIYVIRNDDIQLLTKDHTEVQTILDMGYITPEEAAVHSSRNVLTQAIGVDHNLDVFSNTFEIECGDIFILTTDGLHDLITDEKIKKTILKNENNIKNACDTLVELAIDEGGKDNITVIILKIIDL